MHCKEIKLKTKSVWECIADGPRDPATGKRNQIKRRGRTRGIAKKKVEDAVDLLLDHGIDQRKARVMTFDKVASEWLESYELTGRKKNSIRIRKQQINVLNERIAKVPIIDLTHTTYQRVINDIAHGRARTTVQGINVCAGMIFRYAIRNNLMQHNPSIDVQVPKKRKTLEDIKEENIEEKYLDSNEVYEFLSATLKHGLKYDKERFYTLAFTGMRSGELCALQKSDLDYEKSTISIMKTIYNERNNMREYELTTPKTDGSIRTVKVEHPIINMLKSIVRDNDEHKMQYRMLLDDYHDMDFIFARGNGYPFVTKTILNRMNRILDKTSIKKNATPHIFRHTHISMLTEAGVDIATIMQRVGHEDIETTMRIYTHVTSKMKKDASDKVSTLFGNILEKVNI